MLCGIVSRRPHVATHKTGLLWPVLVYCNVELEAERLKNRGLESEVNIMLIRHIGKTRLDAASIP